MKHLRIFGCCLILLVVAACNGTTEKTTAKGELSVIPQPLHTELQPGFFSIKEATVVYCDPMELEDQAAYLNSKIHNALGFSMSVEEGEGNGICLNLLQDTDDALGEEGYRLQVTDDHIRISANTPNGIFYGIQTLLQMLPPGVKSPSLQEGVDWNVQCSYIEDKPRFPWRGLMLDVSRHFFTKEEVKAYIDQAAEYKMNVFHWHLTDDQGWRIEIKSLPNLTEKGAWRARRVGDWWTRTPRQEGEPATYGGFYTQEDVKEIVNYARERFVTIVPEIDVPGHSMAAIAAYPEISCTATVDEVNVGNKFYTVEENSVCVGKELTFEYMDKIFGEVAGLFPAEYIHVGGDECYKGFWAKCPDCQRRMREENLENTDELQSYFIKRMEKILQSKDKKLVGWDEILEGGLAPNATVMSWRGMSGGVKAAKQGHHVVMTPTDHCYLDLYQGEPSVEPNTYSMCRLSDSYRFEPVPEGVDPELILGGQGNLWTESVPHFKHAEYMTWPRGWALAEVLWSAKEQRDWETFTGKVEKHFVRADYANINYARSMYNAIINPYPDDQAELIIGLDTEIEGLDIYYTFDNTDPAPYTNRYSEPLSVPKDATRLKVITYKGDQPAGEMIKLTIEELKKRASQRR